MDTYLREQCSTTRTAERLFTHRNTVLRRLTPPTTCCPALLPTTSPPSPPPPK
ncbi:helix-turn-helix domain-containing protein [Streptomyces sp. JV178]|uniref:helix-turn-helix domain-containing protein n=1 Tax=Streptomyces sp. JV178 TaxID=858632 RepID=UPI0034D42899